MHESQKIPMKLGRWLWSFFQTAYSVPVNNPSDRGTHSPYLTIGSTMTKMTVEGNKTNMLISSLFKTNQLRTSLTLHVFLALILSWSSEAFSHLMKNTKFQYTLHQLAVNTLLEDSRQHIPQASKSRPKPILCPPWLRFLVSICEDSVTLIPSRKRWVYAKPTWLVLFTLVYNAKNKCINEWRWKVRS